VILELIIDAFIFVFVFIFIFVDAFRLLGIVLYDTDIVIADEITVVMSRAINIDEKMKWT
jgi:hypothetical protein